MDEQVELISLRSASGLGFGFEMNIINYISRILWYFIIITTFGTPNINI